MGLHSAPSLLGRVRQHFDERRARSDRQREHVQAVRDEAEYQARLARWKGRRRVLAAACQPLDAAGPMPRRSPIPEPRQPSED